MIHLCDHGGLGQVDSSDGSDQGYEKKGGVKDDRELELPLTYHKGVPVTRDFSDAAS